MNPSADYTRALDLAKEQHRESKTYSGKFLRPHRKRIKAIINRLECTSILDYGAGRGKQYEWRMPSGQTLEEFWGITVTKYDPAYPPYAKEPTGTFDLVIVTHVLGIIPIPDLDWVIDRIYGLANKAVYIVNTTGSTPKRKKASWRVKNIPTAWGADEWMDILRRHKTNDIEVHFTARPKNPAMKSGRWIL